MRPLSRAVPGPVILAFARVMPRWGAAVLGVALGAGALAASPHADGRYVVRNWRVDDGLPHNTVNRIVQDGRGFLWLATAGGLARFDGLRFEEYPLAQSPREASYNIRDLAVENDDALLMLPASGGIMRVRDGEMTEHPASAAVQDRQLLYLFEERDGTLWLVPTGAGLLRWQNGILRTFGAAEGFNRRANRASFAVDEQNRTWVAAGDFLGWYEHDALHRFAADLGAAVTIAPARSGGFWIATGTRLLRMQHGAMAAVADFGARSDELIGLQAMFENGDGSLWFASRRYGVSRFAAGRIHRVPISHEQASAITGDSEGNIWVATSGGGIDRLRPAAVIRLDASKGLVDKISSSICEDEDGAVWLANRRGGLVRVDADGTQSFKPEPALPQFFANVVYPAADGTIWVGAEQGVFRLRPGERAPEPVEQPLRGIHVLHIARNGDVWIGAGDDGFGVYRDGTFHRFTPDEGYNGHRVKAVVEDSHGSIWVATDDRQVFEFAGGRLVPRITSADMPGGLIYSALIDEDGLLWLATSHGVVLRRGQRLHLFTTKEGLPDNLVSQVLSDGQGRLWFGSRRGIFSVARADLIGIADARATTASALLLGRDEGVVGASALNSTQPMAWRGRDGRLWFTTFEGVVGVDPKTSLPPPVAPRVYIEAVTVNQQPRRPGPILRIAPGAQQFTVQFAALSYSAPERVRMRHRLVGYDSDWVDSRDGRASYNHLPPGEYTLQFTAAMVGGDWNPSPATMNVIIVPSWWQTWWARLAALAAFTAAVAGGVRYWSVRRLRRRVERLERENALERERSRIARDLHDELGGSLTQIGMLAERARRHADESPVRPVLGQLAWHTRRLSDELESIVWMVDPRNDTWDKLAGFIDQYARSFCRDTGLLCQVTGVEQIPGAPLAPEAQHHLLSVMKEALNNVLKHARASRVTVALAHREGVFEMRISDDGAGFDPVAPELADGNGLRNMRTRIGELGGTLEIGSTPGTGTDIVVRHAMSSARHPPTATPQP